ncbi:MAG: hypothetical protein ACREVH_00610 [Gammaproteobacteria bacterium]
MKKSSALAILIPTLAEFHDGLEVARRSSVMLLDTAVPGIRQTTELEH